MGKILSKDYSYNYTSFKGTSDTWKLHGVQDNGALKNTLDTFTNGKGEFRTYERHQVMEQDNLGHITPLEESRVIVKQYSKKDDKLRRAV